MKTRGTITTAIMKYLGEDIGPLGEAVVLDFELEAELVVAVVVGVVVVVVVIEEGKDVGWDTRATVWENIENRAVSLKPLDGAR